MNTPVADKVSEQWKALPSEMQSPSYAPQNSTRRLVRSGAVCHHQPRRQQAHLCTPKIPFSLR
jgi:hypothetical protein